MTVETFTKINNDLLEAVIEKHLSGTEWDVLMIILRYTAGFHRDKWKLSLGFIAKASGRHRITVSHALKRLRERGIVTRAFGASRTGDPAWYRINPPIEWDPEVREELRRARLERCIEYADSTISADTNSLLASHKHPVSVGTNQEIKIIEMIKETGKETGGPLYPPNILNDKSLEENSKELSQKPGNALQNSEKVSSIEQAIRAFKEHFQKQSNLRFPPGQRKSLADAINRYDRAMFQRNFVQAMASIRTYDLHWGNGAHLFSRAVKMAIQSTNKKGSQ